MFSGLLPFRSLTMGPFLGFWTRVILSLGIGASYSLAAVLSLNVNSPQDQLGTDKLGQVGTKSLYYLNDQYQNPEARSVQLFEGRIIREADESDFSLGIDLEGQFSISQQWNNSFTANEFYFRMDPLWSGATIYLGRKRSQWSALDDHWKLGVLQPIYKVDSLNPHTQGLTGLFVDFKQDNWKLEFFGTPFFLPDHGPQMETRNGEFIKGHPWVQYPPSQVVIKGLVTPAYYRIDKPSIPDIIVNTGYGMNFQWGEPGSDGWLVRSAWAYKPMNQLLLGFDGNLNLSGTERLEIDIHPEVGFHEAKSVDFAYRADHWQFYLGGLVDTPRFTPFEQPWTYQNFGASRILGGGIEFLSSSFRVGTGILHREGGDVRVDGPRAGSTSQVLPDRFLFNDLIKLEFGYTADLSSHWSYELGSEWRRELKEGSDIISAQGTLLMGPFWKAFMGMDLLKSENKNPIQSDFIESYQANDRVYGGLQYAF